MSKGKVYIVGAGPGDPGLLTVRAAEVLRGAEVVVYDRLVAPEVLKLIKRSARRIYAGKKIGAALVQERINNIMVAEAKKGRIVVRLKGGDPMIFGRGGQEAEFLVQHHIDYEVVPGITSAIAAPAYAGIPLTHRAHSSSVLIVTGHQAASESGKTLNWKAMASAADTIVILMGAATISRRAKDLLAGGLSEDTPVAVIEWATTRKQKTKLFSLGALADIQRAGAINPPCVIVVGAVASLAKKLDWFRVDGKTTLKK